jgi:hypothetical protein
MAKRAYPVAGLSLKLFTTLMTKFGAVGGGEGEPTSPYPHMSHVFIAVKF